MCRLLGASGWAAFGNMMPQAQRQRESLLRLNDHEGRHRARAI